MAERMEEARQARVLAAPWAGDMILQKEAIALNVATLSSQNQPITAHYQSAVTKHAFKV